jgi:hypothetical protein
MMNSADSELFDAEFWNYSTRNLFDHKLSFENVVLILHFYIQSTFLFIYLFHLLHQQFRQSMTALNLSKEVVKLNGNILTRAQPLVRLLVKYHKYQKLYICSFKFTKLKSSE